MVDGGLRTVSPIFLSLISGKQIPNLIDLYNLMPAIRVGKIAQRCRISQVHGDQGPLGPGN